MTRCNELPFFVRNGVKCTARALGDPLYHQKVTIPRTYSGLTPPTSKSKPRQNSKFASNLIGTLTTSSRPENYSFFSNERETSSFQTHSLKHTTPKTLAEDPLSSQTSFSNSCINWNFYYTQCLPTGPNPFRGAISFDNIGLAWVAIFQVSYHLIYNHLFRVYLFLIFFYVHVKVIYKKLGT